MAARVPFFVVSVALLLIIAYAADSEGPAYSYIGETGPEKWGSLSPSYSACSVGKSQSPIDIVTKKAVLKADLKPLQKEYNPASNATLVNSHSNVGMIYDDAGALILNGKKYELKQMHWHAPSEHRINGVQYPVELHLVHTNDEGNHAVVGILYKEGRADPVLAKIQKKINMLAEEKCPSDQISQIAVGSFNLRLIHRSTRSRNYYRYPGSLTTPPCSENVLWHVLGKVRSISKEQVESLKAPLDTDCKSNSRPVQQLNGRSVELYDEPFKN